MTPHPLRHVLAAGLALAALAPGLGAQTHPNHVQGFQPEKLYQLDGLENVNLFNGNLNLTIPIGGSYPVGGSFSYALTLAYSGNLWEWEEIPVPGSTGDAYYLKPIPRLRSNCGLGWQLSLGRFKPPVGASGNAGRTFYESPDGNLHELLPSLHADGSSSGTFLYTQDGTYLRYDGATRQLESPDGTVRTFDASGRLVEIRDRFKNDATGVYQNKVTITYPASPNYPGITDWKLTDSRGRIQWIRFMPATYYGAVVEKVELRAFGGTTATYTFHYEEKSIARGTTNPFAISSGAISPTETVPLLTQVTLPDGSAYSMPVSDYDLGPPSPGTSNLSGHLKGMNLPTGGRFEWDWQEYAFPPLSVGAQPSKDPYFADRVNHPFRFSVGLAERRHRFASGSLDGRWTYAPVYDSSLPPKEHKVTVTDPLNHPSTYYFSVYLDDFDPLTPEPPGWIHEEYGLPFTHNQADGTSPGRYLSAEIRKAGGELQRKVYVRYERDGLTAANPRLASERTVYVKDASRHADTDYSDFDGVGHYRHVRTDGNFAAGNVRETHTSYNPGLCATCTPATSSAWVLDTYTDQTVTEGGISAKTEACFVASTGFLRRTRTLTSGTTRAGNDLVTRYLKDNKGNVTAEEYFGGDGAGLGTGALCSLALSGPDYRIDHTYQYGTLRTSQYSAMPFKSEDYDVDLNTGLVKTSRDVSGLATTYQYDALGRLTYVKPAQDGWTQYLYYAYDPPTGNPAQVWIYRRPNGGGATLTQEQIRFDHFGRVALERRQMADGTFSDRTTTHYPQGWLKSRSEWGTTAATQYLSYDPFGRPGTIRPPDGSAHDVTLAYTGVRSVARTVRVGTAWNGTSVTESDATTTEIYDRQGRLYQVVEPANPDGSTSTTTYSYDVGGRLAQVSQKAKTTTGTQITQTRLFTYDNRGFLVSERHPEKGAGGNGTVSYSSYDARGHAGRVIDGPNDLTFTYDGAERVTRIRETGGGFIGCSTSWSFGPRCLKELTYGTSNGTGDYRLGKLQVSKRYNYPVLGTTTYTAIVNQTYTYGGKEGRVSARETSLTFNGSTTERFNGTWTWNDLGEVASLGYPQCAFSQYCTATQPRTVSSTYTHGWLTAVPGYASSITYHPNGQVNQVVRTNDTTDTYLKDLNNLPRPRKIVAKTTSGGTLRWNTGLYSFDGAGNLVKAGNAYFTYDPVSRIRSGLLYLGPGAGGATTTFSHTYDGFGNLQALTTTTSRSTPTSSSTNHLSGSVIYDAAGNLTYWNGNSYQYDRFNQVTRMAAGTETWLYMYDADDERVWAFKEGAVPRFDRWTLRDLDGKVLRTYEATDYVWSWSEDHVYRDGTLLASVKPTGTSHLHTDHLGTVRAITNAAGTRTSYHVYYPFGEEATGIAQDTQRMKFTGHERDLGVTTSAADDLDYMHARFYNPQVGRFLATDPVPGKPDLPQSWNRYAYVLNGPVTRTDPTGKCVEDLCIGEGAAAYAAGAALVTATAAWLSSPSGGDPSKTNAQIIGSGIAALGDAIASIFRSEEKASEAETKTTVYSPDRDLPRTEHGVPIPDTDAPHTQQGQRTSSRTGERYPQAREFDANGRPVRDVDFTDHGRPNEHTNPHQHRYDPETGKRLPAEPLPEKPKPPAE